LANEEEKERGLKAAIVVHNKERKFRVKIVLLIEA